MDSVENIQKTNLINEIFLKKKQENTLENDDKSKDSNEIPFKVKKILCPLNKSIIIYDV